jgi:hypothetical protein
MLNSTERGERMIASLTLAIYLFIGLFYAHHKYNEIISEFEVDIDEEYSGTRSQDRFF